MMLIGFGVESPVTGCNFLVTQIDTPIRSPHSQSRLSKNYPVMSYFSQIYTIARSINKGIEPNVRTVTCCAACLKRTDKCVNFPMFNIGSWA